MYLFELKTVQCTCLKFMSVQSMPTILIRDSKIFCIQSRHLDYKDRNLRSIFIDLISEDIIFNQKKNCSK